MTRLISFIILLLGGLFYAPSPESSAFTLPVTVRVRLFSTERPSEVRLTSKDGQTILINKDQGGPSYRSNGPVTIERAGSAAVNIDFPLEVTANKDGLRILVELPFEDYVAAVLAGEASNFKSNESLKAAAIATRSYAAHFLNRHQSEGFDFCDTTHCQDFRITAVNDRLRKAASDTRGQILVYDDQPIAAYYHQDCGGITEGQAPYLPQQKDSFCVSRGRLHWTSQLTAAEIRSVLGVDGVTAIEILDRTSSGRVQRLRFSGSQVKVVEAESFRLAVGRTLGWDRIRSDLYDVRRNGERFVFDGYGSGHGIGMCQDGAAVMGERGFSYREILAYYYPNTRILTLN